MNVDCQRQRALRLPWWLIRHLTWRLCAACRGYDRAGRAVFR